MRKILSPIVSLLLFSPLFAETSLQFMPDPYELGKIPQGEIRHVRLGGANKSSKAVEIETALCQGVGCSNFSFTQKIGPKDAFFVEFDFSTATMEGLIANQVVLVEKNGTPHAVTIQGEVNAPFLFSEKMFDLGYYSAGEQRKWTFYVWSEDLKTRPDLNLPKDLSGEFSVKISNVSLDVEKPDAVREGGKVPAQKIELSLKGLKKDPNSKQKSVSRIVSFKSEKHPKATPEILLVGYWK